ncbi:MAG: hypothetical protein ABSG14_06230 [Verrucomicrobiia bacterium]|jgi:hypothetical protein
MEEDYTNKWAGRYGVLTPSGCVPEGWCWGASGRILGRDQAAELRAGGLRALVGYLEDGFALFHAVIASFWESNIKRFLQPH